MKCTQCGCKKFIKTNGPFSVSWDSGVRVSEGLNVYTCFECGHLEWFDMSEVNYYKNKIADLKKAQAELNTLKAQLAELESPDVLKNMENDCKNIQNQLSSLDITIRQQQELKSELYDLQHKIRIYPGKVENLKKQIKDFESKIKNINESISNIIIVTER